MKKFLVIGNPLKHSLSPKLHGYWIEKNNIKATFEKKEINENEIENLISKIKEEEIYGMSVTKPFKKSVIPFLDKLTPLAEKLQSVNTIYRENKKIVGHNTDIGGFELSVKKINFDIKNKKIFILGAGGVVPSIILGLQNMNVDKIFLSNRTRQKGESLKKIFPNIELVEWGKIPNFDMIVNATSLGLKDTDEIKLDYEKIGSNKLFYDVIYNPSPTNFLKKAKEFGNKTEDGKMMFIYQAHQAFTIWHKIMPIIDEESIKLLNQ